MSSLGFRAESREDCTRAYVSSEPATEGIEFVLKKTAKDEMIAGHKVKVRGDLRATDISNRCSYVQLMRILGDEDVKTERDFYRYLGENHHRFYETALSLRNHGAVVVVNEAGAKISPESPFPTREQLVYLLFEELPP